MQRLGEWKTSGTYVTFKLSVKEQVVNDPFRLVVFIRFT